MVKVHKHSLLVAKNEKIDLSNAQYNSNQQFSHGTTLNRHVSANITLI